MSGQPFSFQFQYNATEERLSDSTVLPEGWYRGRIADMEMRESQTKGGDAGDGYVSLEVAVTAGQYTGNSLYDMLFLWAREGSKASQSTRRRLNSICYATGRPNIQDLNQLMGPEFYFKVTTQEAREVEDPNTGEKKTYRARSQIVNYKSIAEFESESNGQSAQVPASQPQQQAPQFQQQPPVQQQAQVQQQAPVQNQGSPFGGQQQAPVQESQPNQAQQPAGNKPPWVK